MTEAHELRKQIPGMQSCNSKQIGCIFPLQTWIMALIVFF